METNKTTSKILNRNISFDLLRIISAFCVVVLHVCTVYIKEYPVNAVDFRVANFYDSLSRFGIPIFVMISGAIFLSEEKTVTTGKLWVHNILRLFITYWIWSFAYYAFQCTYYWNVSIFHKGIVGVVNGCIYASNHFWFIFMILGLYALVPLLRTWLTRAEKKELNYFVLLFVVFQVLRVTITILADKSLVTEISNKLTITELSDYLGYFVMGHILTKYDVPKKWKRLVYCLIPIGIIANFLISDAMSLKLGYYHAGIYDSFGIFTFLISVAVFVLFKDLKQKIKGDGLFAGACRSISMDTLGVYLLHLGILDFFEAEGLLFQNFSAALGVPVISLLTFAVCCVVSALLRRIPVIGRYLS